MKSVEELQTEELVTTRAIQMLIERLKKVQVQLLQEHTARKKLQEALAA